MGKMILIYYTFHLFVSSSPSVHQELILDTLLGILCVFPYFHSWLNLAGLCLWIFWIWILHMSFYLNWELAYLQQTSVVPGLGKIRNKFRIIRKNFCRILESRPQETSKKNFVFFGTQFFELRMKSLKIYFERMRGLSVKTLNG